jgi:hypothetical protein
MTEALQEVAAQIWRTAGGPSGSLADLTITGPRQVLPSYLDVTGLATGSVAAATLAAAEFLAARNADTPGGGLLPAVTVDSRAASAAFAAEGLFTPVGWDRPEAWDPIAGNYRAQDGWIRLHTNYAHHRAAVERVLGARDKDSVAAAVQAWQAEELEAAVVDAGGCAAAMRTRAAWLASPPGAATATATASHAEVRPCTDLTRLSRTFRPPAASQPYRGIRVLDLTRVIAGPVATRFLAAYGADVLRIDPPGFQEVAALLPETTAGKRTAALDLTAAAGRAAFEDLLATADVLVTGLRADALDRLGYTDEALAAANPGLVIASLDAYGWAGPWRDRRGFDSLVQMSCGIAAFGAAAAGADHPVPLPVQALDHAGGYLVAAAVGRALTRRLTGSVVTRVHASLVAVAGLLWSLPRPQSLPPRPSPADFPLADAMTAWGPARRVPVPGRIAGAEPRWQVEAGPLGRHAPAWLSDGRKHRGNPNRC